MVQFLKSLWELLTWPYVTWKRKRAIKKKLEEIRKRDPFIYK